MMMQIMVVVMFILILMGVLKFIFNTMHLLNSLLSLEFLALSVYLILSIKFFYLNGEEFLNLFYLVLVVCEGVLGLSLLVVSCWSYGMDYMKVMNMSVC